MNEVSSESCAREDLFSFQREIIEFVMNRDNGLSLIERELVASFICEVNGFAIGKEIHFAVATELGLDDTYDFSLGSRLGHIMLCAKCIKAGIECSNLDLTKEEVEEIRAVVSVFEMISCYYKGRCRDIDPEVISAVAKEIVVNGYILTDAE